MFFPQYLLFSQPALVVIGLANPTSISVFEDFIYWVEENSIERANKEVRSPGQPNRGMELKNANDTVKSLKVVSGNIQKGEFLIKLVTNLPYFSVPYIVKRIKRKYKAIFMCPSERSNKLSGGSHGDGDLYWLS